VAFQAGRGDVHTVMVNGKVVKYNHRILGDELNRARQAIEKSVEYIRGQLGEKAWSEAMNPEKAVVEYIENPYTYTDPERARSAQKAVAAQKQENENA
jgi:hypothetical protein